MIRIRGAEQDSPIAVFKCGYVGKLNAVFASTVKSKKLTNDKNKNWIGVFDKTMPDNIVRDILAPNINWDNK